MTRDHEQHPWRASQKDLRRVGRLLQVVGTNIEDASDKDVVTSGNSIAHRATGIYVTGLLLNALETAGSCVNELEEILTVLGWLEEEA